MGSDIILNQLIQYIHPALRAEFFTEAQLKRRSWIQVTIELAPIRGLKRESLVRDSLYY